MIKKLIFSLCFLAIGHAFSQKDSLSLDSLLQDRWELFKIIDNMTGAEILPSHKSQSDFVYYIEFFKGNLRYNTEMNTCTNVYEISGKNEINFEFYDSCTKICCDEEFSEYLSFEDCNRFFIKSVNVLVLISEDRIYYFNRVNSSKQ